jgi:hypothetical protein
LLHSVRIILRLLLLIHWQLQLALWQLIRDPVVRVWYDFTVLQRLHSASSWQLYAHYTALCGSARNSAPVLQIRRAVRRWMHFLL